LKHFIRVSQDSFNAVADIQRKFFGKFTEWSFCGFVDGCIVFKHPDGRQKAFTRCAKTAPAKSVKSKHGWYVGKIC